MSAETKVFKFSYIDHEKEVFIEDNLEKYLVSIGKINLFQQLSYILKEMVGNANKANLKRIHFQINNLDINFATHYEEGIKKFRETLSYNTELYYTEAKKLGHYVKINLNTINNNFVMRVENSTPLLDVEKQRIDERIKKAAKFKNMEDALSEGLDTSEGAGFGLILTVLMLRKLGLTESVFKISNGGKSTLAEVTIPLSLLDKEQEDYIAEIVTKEIKGIPQFPQHILELQRRLSNPNANFSDLSGIINQDPSLIADMLKVANSSMYMLPVRVKSIEEAVRQIGFEGVRNLVLTYSAQKLLMDKYKIDLIRDSMNHSSEVAYYAYEIAKKLNYKDIIDQIYTAAILHDFGKIIINSLKPDIIGKISKLCHNKGISINVVENLTDGYNHSIIGARLAEKWNFSEDLIETIKYHHIPLESNVKYQDMVFIVYIANIAYYYKRDDFTFSNINFHVLKHLNLTDKREFDKFFNPIFRHLDNRLKK